MYITYVPNGPQYPKASAQKSEKDVKPMVRKTATAPKRALRTFAAQPQRSAQQAVRLTSLSVPIPKPGKSAIHKYFYANTVASLTQASAQGRIAVAAERNPAPPNPNPTTPGTINDVQYSIIADVIAVAAHLMDKIEVDACSFLDNKLRTNTAKPINQVIERLRAHQLDQVLAVFERAVDEEKFQQFVDNDELTSRAVYDEINQRAALLLTTMVGIAMANITPLDSDNDWPSVIDDDDGNVTVAATAQPHNASAPMQGMKQASATSSTIKRAKRTTPPSGKRSK